MSTQQQHHCFNKKQDTHHIEIVFNLKARKRFAFISRLTKQKFILVSWYSGMVGETVSWKMKNVSYFPNHDALIRTLNMYKNLNMEIHQQINNVKFYYVNIHHWEFDLSRPANLLTLNKEICWTHIFFHLFFLILF